MQGTFELKDVDQMEAAITVTMKIIDWKALRKRLDTGQFPDWRLAAMISEMIKTAELRFYGPKETNP